nr:flagellar protein FlaG [uncultured Pseudomonas sp.]
MDINAYGARNSGAIDIRPVVERRAEAPDIADSAGHEPASELASGVDVVMNNTDAIGDVIVSLQEFAQSIQRDLAFRVDDSSGRVVVEVRDQSSGEVIRQIPSEEALRLLKHLEEARSLMVNTTA